MYGINKTTLASPIPIKKKLLSESHQGTGLHGVENYKILWLYRSNGKTRITNETAGLAVYRWPILQSNVAANVY